MRVLHDSDERLVVAGRPGPAAWMTAGMGMILAVVALTGNGADERWERLVPGLLGLGLLGLAWMAFPWTRTVFARAEGVAVHEERRLLHRRLTAIPLHAVEGAQVEAEWNEGSRQTRLTLLTADGSLPLERSYGSGDRRAVETAINDWLTRPSAGAAGS
ncbi:hypothetical protein ACW9UR_09935 [Halovulum sp. GXIMD14794]